MTYSVGKVKYSNFGPFVDVTVDFSRPGLTLVEGQTDLPGCESNGSGKSSLLNGVLWALYGRCFKKVGDSALIRRDSEGGMSVRVELVGGSEPVVVTRYREHPVNRNVVHLEVGGALVSRGTNTETDAAIELLLGRDFTTFVNSTAFGSPEMLSFFIARDADRKRVLDSLLGLEIYTDAEKVARRRLADMRDQLTALSNRLAGAEAVLNERRRHVATCPDEDTVAELRLSALIASVRRNLIRRRIERLRQARRVSKAAVDSAEVSAREQRQQYRAVLDRIEEEKNVLRRLIRTNENRKVAAETELRQARAERDSFDKLAGKACPTCTQPITRAIAAKFDETIDARIVDLEATIRVLTPEIAQHNKKLTQFLIPTAPEFPELDRCRDELEAVTERLQRAQDMLNARDAEAHEAETEFDSVTEQVAEAGAGVTDAERAVTEARSAYEELSAQANRLQFWVDGFGNSGLRSFLIEAEVPAINKLATAYARQLLGPGALVQLSATRQLKSRDAFREEITIEAVIPGAAVSYEAASKGQQRRFDLALLLAFRDIIGGRAAKPFSQLFADEMFDGLDGCGVAATIDLLRTVAKRCPVILITHDTRLKSAADRVIVVKHVGGVAVVEDEEQSHNRNSVRTKSLSAPLGVGAAKTQRRKAESTHGLTTGASKDHVRDTGRRTLARRR